jgi:hypothetical protein
MGACASANSSKSVIPEKGGSMQPEVNPLRLHAPHPCATDVTCPDINNTLTKRVDSETSGRSREVLQSSEFMPSKSHWSVGAVDDPQDRANIGMSESVFFDPSGISGGGSSMPIRLMPIHIPRQHSSRMASPITSGSTPSMAGAVPGQMPPTPNLCSLQTSRGADLRLQYHPATTTQASAVSDFGHVMRIGEVVTPVL